MSKLGLAGSALLATAGGATTLASGLTITAHASEKPKTNTQQTNQADKLKKASNQLDTASKQQAKMINALLESKVDAQVPTQPGTYTKSVALLDASGKQLGTATLTRVVNADGSTQSSLSKDIPAGYTLKDVNVLNHYPSAVTLTRVADATPAGTTTKAIKLTDANGKLIVNGTVTRVVDEKGASTVSVKGIPQGYKVASMEVLKTFPDQLVIEKGEAINSNTAENTDAGTMNNVPAGGTTADSRKILDSGGVTKTAGQGNATAGNQSGTTTDTDADKGNTANTGNTTAGQGNQQTGNTASGTTTGNTGSQSSQAQQGGTTSADQGKTDAGTTNTGADANKGQQTSDASKDSSKTSTDSKTTTDQGKTDTKKDDSKTPTSTTDSAKKDDTKKDDSRASTSKNTSASTDEKKDEAKKGDSKSDTSKTDASKTADNSKANDTNSKVDNAIKGIDSVAKGSTDATKSADSKSSDTDKKDNSKKSDSSKSDNKKSDDKKSDKKDGKLDLSDTTDALKKSSKDDDKKDSNSDNSSKKDNVSNLLNKSANKSSKASDNAKVADADVSDNLSGKDDSTKKGTTSSSTNATLPETGNTQSTAGILAGSAMVATMTALGIGATRRKRV